MTRWQIAAVLRAAAEGHRQAARIEAAAGNDRLANYWEGCARGKAEAALYVEQRGCGK